MRVGFRPSFIAALAPLAALLAVAGCSTAPFAEVTRFNIGAPIPSDTITLAPPPGTDAGSLEFRSHAAIVARDLDAVGLHPVGSDGRSAYVGVLNIMQSARQGPPRSSPFRIGIGGGGFSGGGGVGGGVSLPVGKTPSSEIRVNVLDLQIRRRSDSSMIWQGKAVQEVAGDAPESALSAAVPTLSRALLTGFPGRNGETVRVKTGR